MFLCAGPAACPGTVPPLYLWSAAGRRPASVQDVSFFFRRSCVLQWVGGCVCVCARACVCVCARARVRACVRACKLASVRSGRSHSRNWSEQPGSCRYGAGGLPGCHGRSWKRTHATESEGFHMFCNASSTSPYFTKQKIECLPLGLPSLWYRWASRHWASNPQSCCGPCNRRATHSSIHIALRRRWTTQQGQSPSWQFLTPHVLQLSPFSLLQMLLPRGTTRPKAMYVSSPQSCLETPRSVSIILQSDSVTRSNAHACTDPEVPSSFMMSPSSGTPSTSSIDPSADAAHTSRRHRHLHTAGFLRSRINSTSYRERRRSFACLRTKSVCFCPGILRSPWPLLVPRACREKWNPRSTPWIGECEDWHHTC